MGTKKYRYKIYRHKEIDTEERINIKVIYTEELKTERKYQ